MTEYDYSPEAFQAYQAKLKKIAQWTWGVPGHDSLRDPFTAASPAPPCASLPEHTNGRRSKSAAEPRTTSSRLHSDRRGQTPLPNSMDQFQPLPNGNVPYYEQLGFTQRTRDAHTSSQPVSPQLLPAYRVHAYRQVLMQTHPPYTKQPQTNVYTRPAQPYASQTTIPRSPPPYQAVPNQCPRPYAVGVPGSPPQLPIIPEPLPPKRPPFFRRLLTQLGVGGRRSKSQYVARAREAPNPATAYQLAAPVYDKRTDNQVKESIPPGEPRHNEIFEDVSNAPLKRSNARRGGNVRVLPRRSHSSETLYERYHSSRCESVRRHRSEHRSDRNCADREWDRDRGSRHRGEDADSPKYERQRRDRDSERDRVSARRERSGDEHRRRQRRT